MEWVRARINVQTCTEQYLNIWIASNNVIRPQSVPNRNNTAHQGEKDKIKTPCATRDFVKCIW